MKKIHLINDTYQVYTDDEATVLFQGTSNECDDFMCRRFIDKIINDPKIMDVFKRLADK